MGLLDKVDNLDDEKPIKAKPKAAKAVAKAKPKAAKAVAKAKPKAAKAVAKTKEKPKRASRSSKKKKIVRKKSALLVCQRVMNWQVLCHDT